MPPGICRTQGAPIGSKTLQTCEANQAIAFKKLISGLIDVRDCPE
jgi:hypothetical protein